MKVHRLYLTSIFIFVFVAASCSNNREGTQPVGTPAPTVSPTPATVVIGYSKLRISLPIFVAQEQNLFQRHGVSISLEPYETAQPMAQALVEGKVNVAGYTALPITYNAILRSNQSLYFATAMLEDQQHRISYLLRKKGSDIKTISDLRGKQIGILPTIAYKSWLQEILRANKVPLDSVVIQQLAPELQVSTLATGGVQALFTNDPMATAALVNGAGEFITDTVEMPKYLGEPFLFGSFNARKDWADTHPTEFAAIIAALDEAIGFVNQHPSEAKQAMRKYIPAQFGNQVALYPDAMYLASSKATRDMFQKEADAELKFGVIPKALDLNNLVYGSFAARAK